MMKPTLNEYRHGATTWRRSHKNVQYTLSHHGISDYNNEGTWCFYIHLIEPMFLNSADFEIFWREEKITESFGSHYATHDYYSVPDYGFNGGCTFYETDVFIDKDGTKQRSIKYGCDYAHLCDQERGYPDTLDSVNFDAKKFIDALVEAHPLKTVCGYSGMRGHSEEFYTDKSGRTIHKSHLEKLKEQGWDAWLPAERATQ